MELSLVYTAVSEHTVDNYSNFISCSFNLFGLPLIPRQYSYFVITQFSPDLANLQPFSRDNYQLEKVNATRCFLQDTWCHRIVLNCCSCYITGQLNTLQAKLLIIFDHKWAHRCFRIGYCRQFCSPGLQAIGCRGIVRIHTRDLLTTWRSVAPQDQFIHIYI